MCPLARHARLPFPVSESIISGCLELVHMDVWGPFTSEIYDQKMCFLIFLDDLVE